MATDFLSLQEVGRRGSGPSPPRKFRSVESGGKVFRALFSAILPASGLAIGDTIALLWLPRDVAVVGGQLCWSQGQGAATTAIGTVDDPDKYFVAATTVSPNVVRFAETQRQHFATVLLAEEVIVATNGAAAWIPQSTLKGFIEYIGA